MMRIWGLILVVFAASTSRAQVGSSLPTPTHLKLVELADHEGLPFFYNDDIEQVVKDYARNYRGSSSILLGRFQYYDSAFSSMCSSMDLPTWLLFVPLANTGYDNKFRDSTGACGFWPLAFNIGKKYGLRETALLDDRYDPELSTQAALKYLSALYNIYQDWRLAILAFRMGPIPVNALLHSMNGLKSFDSIFELLEPEARQIIVQFYATVVAFHRSENAISAIDLIGPKLSSVPFTPAVGKGVTSLSQPITFTQLNSFFGLEWRDFQELNSSLKSTIVPYPGYPLELRLPVKIADSFNVLRDSFERWINSAEKSNDSAAVEETTQSPQPSIGPEYVWIYYKIKSGDNVYTLADVFDCSTNQLRAWNRISGNNIIAGKTLKFHVSSSRRTYYNSINSMSHAQKKNLAARD
jgi:membrane-bound lytic murein transglycosylase D